MSSDPGQAGGSGERPPLGNEERLRSALAAAGLGTFHWDIAGNTLEWDEGFERLFGLPAGVRSAHVTTFMELVHPGDRDPLAAAIERSAAHGSSLEHEFRVRSPDGGARWLALRGKASLDADARPCELTGVLADVTRRKQAEAALAESEARLRLAQESAGAGLWDWDLATGAVSWSAASYRLSGLDPATEPSYANFLAPIEPEDRERVDREVREAIARRGDLAIEFRIRHPERGERWLAAFGRTSSDTAGRPVRMTGITLDVTDKKRDEAEIERLNRDLERRLAELRQAKEAAEAASAAKDRFLATLSHELRTPLTPVLAIASAVAGDPRLPTDLTDKLAMVQRNVELEARLIDDLLDLTRIARGKLELARELVDLRRVLEHAVEICCGEARAQGRLRVVVDLGDPEAGAGCTPRTDLRLWGDAARLTQAFSNLLHNAVKFTPAGGSVSVAAASVDGRLTVVVADTGIGIDPQVLPRIFDGFEQGQRGITRRFGGLGLGLAIARAVVELHGGTLAATSDGPGAGAAFTAVLPAAELAAMAAARPSVATAGGDGATPPDGRPLSILLVEDHPDTASAMAALLAARGHAVTVAHGVAEGLAAAAARSDGAGRLDLVVSDLGLPDGSGFDLMRELKESHGLPGIALSGYGMEEDVAKSRAAGFVRHLTKPVTMDALETAIREAAGSSRV